MNFFEAMEAVNKGKAVTNPECSGIYYKGDNGQLVYNYDGLDQKTNIAIKEQVAEWEFVERQFSFEDAVIKMVMGYEVRCVDVDKVVCLEGNEFLVYCGEDVYPFNLTEKAIKSKWTDA